MVYPARLRENVYCSSLCRERHSRILVQERRREHPDRGPHDRFRRRERKYGISRAKFDKLYDQQLGRCALCLTPLSEVKKIHVDHDHKTRKIRGLLCGPCNVGLGMLKDDPVLLERAAGYIRENRVRKIRRVREGVKDT
jgi:Autographiviridae endonuclease VII